MKVFIAGSRLISGLPDNVLTRLSQISEKGYDVLVGDCDGVDAAVQKHYASNGYRKIVIYASNGKVRNNIGNWEVNKIAVSKNKRGFEFYRQKDIAMANDADVGFMIWDGRSRGTLSNMVCMLRQGKSVMLNFNGSANSILLGNMSSLILFLSENCSCSDKLLRECGITSYGEEAQMSITG